MCVCFFFSSALYASCTPEDFSQLREVDVVTVLDGDTLRLADEDVRLVGVNTPEMNYGKSKKPEPYAVESTQFVKTFVSENRVFLEKAGWDKYQRRLGQIWVALKGDLFLLSEYLLKNGYAFQVFESESRYVSCLRQAEIQARDAKKGVWGALEFWLNVDRGGFVLWSGRLNRVTKSKRYSWLSFSDQRVVRVPNQWFEQLGVKRDLQGEFLEVRGWAVRREKTRFEPYMLPLKSPQIFLEN
ncbi:thermonuclease family protein [Litoribrevibacter albus]|uniref:thermonuclease family protein n=1 Tax=Litoribrevibacter albus TaxID=1473156 RepID=UPI0024E0D9B6|nr:thermonuclease family protein [Litoribrevibacter albus]